MAAPETLPNRHSGREHSISHGDRVATMKSLRLTVEGSTATGARRSK